MAKEQKPESNMEFSSDVSAVPESPKSFRLYTTLGLSSLIVCQMIVLWLLLPSRNAAQEHVGVDPPTGVVPSSEQLVEISLQNDPFKVKQLRGDEMENLTLRIHVLVKKKEASKFSRQHEQYTQRVIDRVGEILHSSSRAERQERGLNALKEKTKQGINETLGTSIVQKVLVSEYSFSVE